MSDQHSIGRRAFVAGSAAGVVMAATSGPRVARAASGTVPQRQLGSTGESVSCIGMGGYHLGKPATDAETVRLVHMAMDRGITFFDNSWDYNDGLSEKRLGLALAGGRRDNVFVMTKVDGRDAVTAMKQLDESLARLKTDHVDLWQFHEILRSNDPPRIFAEGGAYQAALAAKKAGKIRFIGYTGHKAPAKHLEMLSFADMHGWTPDSVQMPVNVLDPHYDSFVLQVVPVLAKRKIAVLGMKTFGDPFVLKAVRAANAATPLQMLRFSLSQPTSVVITGIDKAEILDQAVAASLAPVMDDTEMAALLERTRPIALTGVHERFKTSYHFDSTHTHPEWLGPSGQEGHEPGQ